MAAATAIVAVAALAGCSGGGSGSGTGDGADVVEDGTFTLSMVADPGALDPQASAVSSLFQLSQFAYDALVSIDEKGDIQSQLAKEWELDGDTVTLTLNDGITCSDGSEFTAATAAENLDLDLRPREREPLPRLVLPRRRHGGRRRQHTDDHPRGGGAVRPAGAVERAHGVRRRPRRTATSSPTAPRHGALRARPRRRRTTTTPTRSTRTTRGARAASPRRRRACPSTIVARIIPNETTAANLVIVGRDQRGRHRRSRRAAPRGRRTVLAEHRSPPRRAVVQPERGAHHQRPRGAHGADAGARPRRAAEGRDERRGRSGHAPHGDPARRRATTTPSRATCPRPTSKPPRPRWTRPAGSRAPTASARRTARSSRSPSSTPTRSARAARPARSSPSRRGRRSASQVTATQNDSTTLTGALFGTGDWDIAWVPLNVSNPDQVVGFVSGPAAPDGTNFAGIQNADYDGGRRRGDGDAGHRRLRHVEGRRERAVPGRRRRALREQRRARRSARAPSSR